ncbi:hypothetical protein ACFVEN_45405, partial [Streptomyces sp. NPDC057681]
HQTTGRLNHSAQLLSDHKPVAAQCRSAEADLLQMALPLRSLGRSGEVVSAARAPWGLEVIDTSFTSWRARRAL